MPAGAPESPPERAPLKSIHTNAFPGLLQSLGVSLIVTTYQAGKVIVVRSDGTGLNTHYRDFARPMGLAVDRSRLALGTHLGIWMLREHPDAAPRIKPEGRHDTCYLPYAYHVTGGIAVHELGWGTEGLWIVNTRFSCLATLDGEHSFVPRWRPPFVTALAPEDRCHLNGLAMADGRPRYVTALGETDQPGGWRANKASGGCLLDVDNGRILARGLSMPHSPRLHQGRTWILESGEGNLSLVDPEAGRVQRVAQLPGFTRGLDFCGPYAFIGLSQIRETATFGELPITRRLKERTCGVWVVELATGKTAAYLRFDSGVQEIFAVQVLQGVRYPEIFNGRDKTLLPNTFMLPKAAG